MHDIAEFLIAHDPFSSLEPEKVERLAQQVEIEYFEAGTTIFREGSDPPDAMWVVRTGAVELVEGARVLDLLEEGEPFGHPWMLSGLPTGWEARTRENSLCYRLPAAEVIPLLANPAGLRSMARVLMEAPRPGGPPTPRTEAIDTGDEPVRTLIRKHPVICRPDVSLQEAAARMDAEGVSSILVDLNDGELGIVTDRDVRSRVVATGLSLDTPVAEVMTAPAFTASVEQKTGDLLLAMLERGIRHVPVLSARRQLVGVVTDVDLLSAQTRTPITLRRAIADAPDIESLRRTAQQVRPTVIAMHNAGLYASRISEIFSVIVDSLFHRVIELEIAGHGPPPVDFGWLSLGSFGRREAVPSSDIDTGMAWSTRYDEDPEEYMHRLAGAVIDELGRMGWRPDEHGVTATGIVSASSMQQWRTAILSWLRGPVSEPAMIAISIVLDARQTYGPDEPDLDVPSLLRDAHPRDNRLRLLLRLALANRPPTGFLRDIVVERSGEHAGRFDIKHGGLLPVVNIARYTAFVAHARTTSTTERLRAAAEAGTLAESDAETLEAAFELFSELRLEHQVRQLERGHEPDNRIDPKTLDPLTRRYLREAFRAVASVQRALSTELAWKP
jgi:CBS domain-containing protein